MNIYLVESRHVWTTSGMSFVSDWRWCGWRNRSEIPNNWHLMYIVRVVFLATYEVNYVKKNCITKIIPPKILLPACETHEDVERGGSHVWRTRALCRQRGCSVTCDLKWKNLTFGMKRLLIKHIPLECAPAFPSFNILRHGVWLTLQIWGTLGE